MSNFQKSVRFDLSFIARPMVMKAYLVLFYVSITLVPLALVYAKATHVRRLWKTEAWCELTNVGGNNKPPISAGGSIVLPECKEAQ